MKKSREDKQAVQQDPSRLRYFLYRQRKYLVPITVTGILYNVGMTAGPWFEGQLAQMLADIFAGSKTAQDMVRLALSYVAVIFLVQFMRYLKRLYVRRFANQMSRDMKTVLYRSLLALQAKGQNEEAGTILTKAVADVDDCVEGVRKFTTEVFDTGVVMVAYAVMLVGYDWRLALLVMLFPPVAYYLANRLKGIITRTGAAAKESAGQLNGETLDRITNALTYRVYGQESNRNRLYEERLSDYEHKSALADIFATSMQPLYQIITMAGVVFVLYFGSQNVMGTGWALWNIAAFTTFLSCFVKLAGKASKAAKLFNAVQKAQVSWNRIQPLMQAVELKPAGTPGQTEDLVVSHVSFAYPGGPELLQDVNFTVPAGTITGVTGSVASGKSTLGRLFLGENPYAGTITYGGKDLRQIWQDPDQSVLAYMGHDPELFSGTIEENIRLGQQGDIGPVLKTVCMDEDLKTFEEGVQTRIGSGGIRLSGGQQARIALARVLFHGQPLLVLDDPFAALDQKTEETILANLRRDYSDRTILLISHRLRLFHTLDQVLFVADGKVEVGSHEELMKKEPRYRALVEKQTKGGDLDAE